MSNAALYRWDGETLVAIDYCDPGEFRVEVVDSFLVSEGRSFALGLHWSRFRDGVEQRGSGLTGAPLSTLKSFGDAALGLIPRTGHWFPRLELQSKDGAAHLVYRHRPAPELSRSAVVAPLSHPDPRTVPSIKGPDVDVLLGERTAVRLRGADDAVILTRDGYVVDGTTSAIVWWRGDILCGPPLPEDAPEFDRVDSVTARSLFGLASVLGVDTHRERVTPAELEGCEVWLLNALHGIRIVTEWIDGPNVAELPGRLGVWQHRHDALFTPIGALPQ
jgi:Amino-transferase class IV